MIKDLLGEQTLELYTVNNSLLQFDGFVEITFALLSKDVLLYQSSISSYFRRHRPNYHRL